MNCKGRVFIGRIVLLSCFITLVGSAAFAADAQKAVEWKLLCSWTPEFVAVKNILNPLVAKITQKSAGKLKISSVGPEVVPPFAQLKPLREGLFDILFTHPAYHYGEMSVGVGMDFAMASSKQRRDAGMVKILDEAYREKKNATYIGAIGDGVGYNAILKSKLGKADLNGLKVRTNPFFDPLVKALGGAAVSLSPGDMYTALDKGVVDGAFFPALGIKDYKWYEVTKYLLRPCFGDTVYAVLVNLKSWNNLPKEIQDIVLTSVMEIEVEGRKTMTDIFAEEEKNLLKLGMELNVLPPDEGKKLVDTFYERGWSELVVKKDFGYGKRLREAADSIKK